MSQTAAINTWTAGLNKRCRSRICRSWSLEEKFSNTRQLVCLGVESWWPYRRGYSSSSQGRSWVILQIILSLLASLRSFEPYNCRTLSFLSCHHYEGYLSVLIKEDLGQTYSTWQEPIFQYIVLTTPLHYDCVGCTWSSSRHIWRVT